LTNICEISSISKDKIMDVYKTKFSLKKEFFQKPEDYYSEAVRYYKNAKNILKRIKIKDDRYQDLKPVREACGTAYLAILLVFDGYFIHRGLDRNKLPISTDEYWRMLKKNNIHNGKILNAFSGAYEVLHLWGYYRGIGEVRVVKDGFERAKLIIGTLSKKSCE